MTERRTSPRYRAEILIDFALSESKTTGITYDVSRTGMFVRTSRLPAYGQKLLATLRFPDGRQLLTQGDVVRTFHPSIPLRGLLPTGFGMNVKNNDGYRRFVGSAQADEVGARKTGALSTRE